MRDAFFWGGVGGKKQKYLDGSRHFHETCFLAFQFRDDGLISNGFLSHFDEDFRADGEIDIDS